MSSMKRYLLAFAIILPATMTFASTSAWTVGHLRSSTSPYSPNASATFNPAGQSVTIFRNGPGEYVITFAGLGPLTAGGNVQISAANTAPTTTNFDRNCTVRSFVKSGKDVVIRIRCYNTMTGAPADTDYSLLFTTK